MCIAFYYKTDNKTIFVLNRDEFYSRKSISMQFHKESGLYFGQDTKKNGSWLVINKYGEFSFVTNIRKKALYDNAKRSRGEIPFKLLRNEKINLNEYNPCNVVKVSSNCVTYMNSIEEKTINIKEDVFGISNSLYPSNWPKVTNGLKHIKALELNQSNENLIKEILVLMQNKAKYDFVAPNTGFSPEQERILTPIFIETPEYGTVSTTVLIYEQDYLQIYEKDYINNSIFSDSIKLD